MSVFKLLPINIIIIIIYLLTIYVLFELIRHKNILHRTSLLSCFIFLFSLSIASFINLKSLGTTIIKIGGIISILTLIVGFALGYLKGDNIDKQRVRDVLIVFLSCFLIASVIIGLALIIQ